MSAIGNDLQPNQSCFTENTTNQIRLAIGIILLIGAVYGSIHLTANFPWLEQKIILPATITAGVLAVTLLYFYYRNEQVDIEEHRKLFTDSPDFFALKKRIDHYSREGQGHKAEKIAKALGCDFHCMDNNDFWKNHPSIALKLKLLYNLPFELYKLVPSRALNVDELNVDDLMTDEQCKELYDFKYHFHSDVDFEAWKMKAFGLSPDEIAHVHDRYIGLSQEFDSCGIEQGFCESLDFYALRKELDANPKSARLLALLFASDAKYPRNEKELLSKKQVAYGARLILNLPARLYFGAVRDILGGYAHTRRLTQFSIEIHSIEKRIFGGMIAHLAAEHQWPDHVLQKATQHVEGFAQQCKAFKTRVLRGEDIEAEWQAFLEANFKQQKLLPQAKPDANGMD